MECEYEVTVTFHSLSNPSGTLAIGRPCDGNFGTTPAPRQACDTYVAFCLKPVTEASMNNDTDLPGICGSEGDVTSTQNGALFNTDNVIFNDNVFGLPNPVSIFGSPQVRKLLKTTIKTCKNSTCKRYVVNSYRGVARQDGRLDGCSA